jgi:hypothetical protein
MARARVYRTRELSGFTTPTSRAAGAVQSALGAGGRGREIFALATYSFQFAKAGSAATLSQQEKNNTADVHRSRVNITGFMCTVACSSSRRCNFDEFESFGVATRRR